jgi:alkylhydroperoxidase family enzyme
VSESLRNRPVCSVPMVDADKHLDNFNWTKGLQSESDWIWSGNLNPVPFPNNLARYFLHVPGIFEQQLNYSTTLIFDEPSFRNGVQISGYLPRVTRELVISSIAQLRRSQYSMTHHAILGTLTARKHKLSDTDIANKWAYLLDVSGHSANYTRVERAALLFARCFATDPKSYSDDDYAELRDALAEHNRRAYWEEAGWLAKVRAARAAWALALNAGQSPHDAHASARAASDAIAPAMPDDENEHKINAQVVELGFLALQFVALTGVFSSLNVPDEEFLRGVFDQVVPKAVRDVIDAILAGTTDGMPSLIPSRVEPPAKEISSGQVRVDPTGPRGTRIPLVSWEREPTQGTRDKGLALGGIHVGVYGWSFGAYFPGSLTYALMHHGELARFEAPYSLPLLFNEDEWRNGTQTAGYNRPPVKELVIQKVYHITRSRYGLEHHTMFFFNAMLQQYGVGAFRIAGMTDEQHSMALAAAIGKAEAMVLNLEMHRHAPSGIFSPLEVALLDWIEAFIAEPHAAHRLEPKLRAMLLAVNREEVAARLRVLDTTGVDDEEAAMNRLVDHQIAELAMITGHMDGLGRFLTILQLESELPVSIIEPSIGTNNSIELQLTGTMNNRPGLFDALRFAHVPDSVLTYNELLANPSINKRIRDMLGHDPIARVHVTARGASPTAEF